MGWLIPRQELSSEQIRAVLMDARSHRLIVGAPGSGKTQILLHRAARLVEETRVATSRFQIFVFTNVLKEYIRSALTELGLPPQNVCTLDDWCRRTYEQLVSKRLPWKTEDRRPDFKLLRSALLPALRGKPPLFDFALVDEAQDLEPECFDILTMASKHVTACLDHKQQLYDHGSSYETVIHKLGIRRSDISLIDAFRCCPYIVELSAEFIEDRAEREAFLNQTRTFQTERLTPLLYGARSFEDERESMVAVLKQRLLQDKSIAVLFPTRSQVAGFANAFRASGIEVETQVARDDGGLDFASSRPKLITFHSAKGLTFDTVLLPRLVPNSFRSMSESRINRMLYVGITRATKWVYMSTVETNTLPQLDKIHRLAERRPAPVTVTTNLLPEQSPRQASAAGADDPYGLL